MRFVQPKVLWQTRSLYQVVCQWFSTWGSRAPWGSFTFFLGSRAPWGSFTFFSTPWRGAPEARGPMWLHRLHWLKAGPERAQILWNWKITVGLPSFIVCLPIITWTAIVRQTFLANMLAGLLGMQSPALEPSQHSSMPGGQSCYRCYGQLSSSCVPNKIAMPSEFVMWPFWPIVFG